VRTLAITQNITVDGAVEMLDDWFEPSAQADQSDLLAELRRQDDASDAMLLGRRTFEDFRGYWRHRDDDPTGIGAQLDRVPKYVVSSTLADAGWENTTVLKGDATEEVRALKEQPGTDIIVTGSIMLSHALVAAGLVDEYRLFVYPVVQGRGRRLLPEGVAASSLRLVYAATFRCGVTFARYARA
jgi:dihydrofolate reductase